MPEITTKTMLDWLDRHRTAVNEQIVTVHSDEKAAWMPELQIINALAERVRDMTAVEYARAHDEICDAHQHCMCASCPLGNNCVSLCSYGGEIHIAVEIAKRWKEEHHD